MRYTVRNSSIVNDIRIRAYTNSLDEYLSGAQIRECLRHPHHRLHLPETW